MKQYNKFVRFCLFLCHNFEDGIHVTAGTPFCTCGLPLYILTLLETYFRKCNNIMDPSKLNGIFVVCCSCMEPVYCCGGGGGGGGGHSTYKAMLCSVAIYSVEFPCQCCLFNDSHSRELSAAARCVTENPPVQATLNLRTDAV